MNFPNRWLVFSLREIVFGLEDGIVSTLGVITGIAEGTKDRYTILLAGLVIIAVESLSMAAGTYLSNKSEEEVLARVANNSKHARLHLVASKQSSFRAFLMGVAYVVGGAVPVLPYMVVPLSWALGVSVVAAVAALVAIGIWKARVTGTNIFRSVLEIAGISLVAALVGFIIGRVAGVFNPALNRFSLL
ncbi:hypothetical protein A3A66_03875 [Microgenomates group bacterium RIFCSPLOWO2_01_FULL_46_13]|nr:MAG: hypothetical protein A2783_01360 [Microgenomates group bacterium RIFCSPHIGHO2_01_FULL_45_11]OGV94929.1 MAG: hypothetical protein A3A66_03875 [Microgenomates group bacterium RIFCSPLOWO2_01_FULL_46_13]